MVISGMVVIVEADPGVASVWTEVAAYAGFTAAVVSQVSDVRTKQPVHAVVVRIPTDWTRVPVEWKGPDRPRLIALAADDDVENPALQDFDVVLRRDGQVRALYAELHRLVATL